MGSPVAVALVLVLVAGCGAKATPEPPDAGAVPDAASADVSGGGQERPLDRLPAPLAEGGSGDGALAADGPAQDAATATDRAGRIPPRPPGAPPCAPEAMAVHDGRCPYPVVVACAPNPAARPRYVCYCFAPPSSGKWVCQEEGDGGGVVTTGAR